MEYEKYVSLDICKRFPAKSVSYGDQGNVMSKTVKQIADELGVVHQKRKSKQLSTTLQSFIIAVDGSFTYSFTLQEDRKIVYLMGVDKLQEEREKEREHNRNKNRQFLGTLNKWG